MRVGGSADALWSTFAEQQAQFEQMAKSGQIKVE